MSARVGPAAGGQRASDAALLAPEEVRRRPAMSKESCSPPMYIAQGVQGGRREAHRGVRSGDPGGRHRDDHVDVTATTTSIANAVVITSSYDYSGSTAYEAGSDSGTGTGS